jgi:hypothetical protein
MTLGELLDELRNNILRDRSTAVTTQNLDAQLWTDETLVSYIDEAYFKFARQTLLLRDDSSPEVTQITLLAETGTYALDPRVVAVHSAVLADGVALVRSNTPIMEHAPANVSWGVAGRGVPCGRPRLFASDTAQRVLRLYPVPGADFDGTVLQLRVSRLPLTHLSLDDLNNPLEMDPDHHLDILEWAAYRALRNHDVDSENLIKASAHKKHFNEAVAAAQVALRRQTFEPVTFGVNTDWS